MSPGAIEIILHCHCTRKPWEPVSDYSDGIIKEFLEQKLITWDYDAKCHRTTEKGAKWIEMICETPFPVQMYVDPRTLDKLGRMT